MKKYNVGVIGLAHFHVEWNLTSFAELKGRFEFIAACDVPPYNNEPYRINSMRSIVNKFGIKKVYSDYQKMLDEMSFDLIIVCCENAYHADICSDILLRGINVIVEKPMATTYSGALKMTDAANKGNAALIVNWPSTWSKEINMAYKLMKKGAVGKVFKFHYKNAYSLGPLEHGQNVPDIEKGKRWWHKANMGGGAILDYCSYGCNLSRWFLGRQAVFVNAIKANFNSRYGDAEDYGILTIDYGGAIAVAEGSWTTISSGDICGPVIYGLDGTMICRETEEGSKIFLYKEKGSVKPSQIFDIEPLDTESDTLAKQFLGFAEKNIPLHPTMSHEVNMDAMSILDAGIGSALSGKKEAVYQGDESVC